MYNDLNTFRCPFLPTVCMALVSVLQEQVEFEQKYLLLEETQRQVLDVLLAEDAKPLSPFEIRMAVWRNEIVPAYIVLCKKEFVPGFVESAQERKSFLFRPQMPTLEALEKHYEESPTTLEARRKTKEFFDKLRALSPRETEQEYRKIAVQLNISGLPSNHKLNRALDELHMETGWLECKIVTEGDRRAHKVFLVSRSFYSDWQKIRASIISNLKSKKLEPLAITSNTRRFWKLPLELF